MLYVISFPDQVWPPLPHQLIAIITRCIQEIYSTALLLMGLADFRLISGALLAS
jgi:hypothetical protein